MSHIPQHQFDTSCLQGSLLSLVHFGREFNGASQIVSMILQELKKEYGTQVSFYSLDADQEKTLAAALGVRELPVILFFKNGELIDAAPGLVSKNRLIAKIELAFSDQSNIKKS